MNDTTKQNKLRTNSPFQTLHQEAVNNKEKIEFYKKFDNFTAVTTNGNLSFGEKVLTLFCMSASSGHLEKLSDLIDEMNDEEMHEMYVRHMDYVGNLPGLARLFTYSARPFRNQKIK